MKRKLNVLSLLYAAAVLMISGGLLTLAVIVPYIPPPANYVVGLVSLLVIIIGVLFYRRIDEVRYRFQGRRFRKGFAAIAILAVLLVNYFAPALATQYGVGANECSTECWQIRQRVVTAEYSVVGMLVVAFFLALGPVLFARTVLGPIVGDIAQLAGSALIVLIFALLVVYPLHVMFVPCYVGSTSGWGYTNTQPNGCYVDVCQLVNNGPILLRVLLQWLLPPSTGC